MKFSSTANASSPIRCFSTRTMARWMVRIGWVDSTASHSLLWSATPYASPSPSRWPRSAPSPWPNALHSFAPPARFARVPSCGLPASAWRTFGKKFAITFSFWADCSAMTRSLENGAPMHLSPRELDKLLLHNAGFLAQKRLARGVRLNHPESVALIATQLLEFIRDGRRVAELMDLGRQFLGRNQVMSGVPEMIAEVQVEGTFRDGTKLITVHHPIASENGNLTLALYGTFLPVPDLSIFKRPSSEISLEPGSYEIARSGTGRKLP